MIESVNRFMQDSDFVNKYIEQLNKSLHDQVSRNVIVETQHALAVKALEESNKECERLKIELDKLKKKEPRVT